MSTHNIWFHREIRNILCGYPLLPVAIDIHMKQLRPRSACLIWAHNTAWTVNAAIKMHLAEALLMSTHNIFFYGGISKIIPEISPNTPPY